MSFILTFLGTVMEQKLHMKFIVRLKNNFKEEKNYAHYFFWTINILVCKTEGHFVKVLLKQATKPVYYFNE